MEGPPLYTVRRNVVAMMAARDYIVEDQEKTPDEFVRDFCYSPPDDPRTVLVNRDLLAMSLVHKVTRMPMRVFFLEPGSKFGKKQLQRLLDRMGDTITRAVVVVPDGSEPTPPAKKMMDEMNRGSDAVFLQWFSEAELSTNIMNRNRGSTYKVLLNHERDAVIKRYGLPPTIWYNDPVARYFGLQRNQMIKCTRGSETAGRYATYKICRYTEEVPRDTTTQKKKRVKV